MTLKIIGIKSYDEALKIYENEKHQDKIDAKKNNIRILLTLPLMMLLASAIVLVLFACFDGFETMFTTWHAAKIIMLVVVNIVAIVVSHSCGDYDPKVYLEDFSPIWQYAKVTKGYNVLARTLKYNDWNGYWELELDLEDKETKSVSYAKVKPFWSTVKTDVDDYVVDLEKHQLIKPYNTDNCRLKEILPVKDHKKQAVKIAQTK